MITTFSSLTKTILVANEYEDNNAFNSTDTNTSNSFVLTFLLIVYLVEIQIYA